jgi:hypothetical protein
MTWIGRAKFLIQSGDGILLAHVATGATESVLYVSWDVGENWDRKGSVIPRTVDALVSPSLTRHLERFWVIGGAGEIHTSVDLSSWTMDRSPGVEFGRGNAAASFAGDLWIVDRGVLYRYR